MTMPLSEDVLQIARAAAAKMDLSPDLRFAPTFALAEEVCGDEYEEMLQLLHEDEVFAPVDLDVQERAVDAIKEALTEDQQGLVDDLVDNQSRHVWLQQEAAFHLGLAVGLRLAEMARARPAGRTPAAGDGA
jgi:hypothetical protein